MAAKVKERPKVNNMFLESQWETRRTQWTWVIAGWSHRLESRQFKFTPFPN